MLTFVRIKQFLRMVPFFNFLPDWWVRATTPLFAQLCVQQLEYMGEVQTILNDETKRA